MGSLTRGIRRRKRERAREICRAVRIATDRCIPTFKLTGCTVSIPSEETALAERVVSVTVFRQANRMDANEVVTSNSIVPSVWSGLMIAAMKRLVDRNIKETSDD